MTFSTAFEAGEVSSLAPVPIHLPTVLAQVVDAVNVVEQKAGGFVAVKLHCNNGVNNDCEDIIADPFFHRVLFGLLSNAVKFSPPNGVVDLTVSYVGSDDNNLNSSNNGNKNYSRRTSIVTNNVMTGCVNSNIHNTNISINNSSDIKNNNDSLNNCNGNMKTNYNDIKNNNNNNNDLDRFEENFYCVSLNDTGSMLPSDLDTKNENLSQSLKGNKLKIVIPPPFPIRSSAGSTNQFLAFNESMNKCQLQQSVCVFEKDEIDLDCGKNSTFLETTSNSTSSQSICEDYFDKIDSKLNRIGSIEYQNILENFENDPNDENDNEYGNSNRATTWKWKEDENDIKCDHPGGTIPSPGTFTFHFRNNTIKPMNIKEIRNYFKYYNHAKPDAVSECGDTIYVGSVNSVNEHIHNVGQENDKKNNNDNENNEDTSEPKPSLNDSNKNRRRKSSSLIPCNFSDLKQYEGLGLGLYTAHNMVNLMGGQLECSANNDEACFWFTIPSSCLSTSSSTTPMKYNDVTQSLSSSFPQSQLPSKLHSELSSKNCSSQTSPEKHSNSLMNKISRRLSRSKLSPETTSRKLFASNPPVLTIPSFEILSDCERGKSVSPSPSNSEKIVKVENYSSCTLNFSQSGSSSGSTVEIGRLSRGNSVSCNSSFGNTNEIRVLVVDDSRICQKVANRALSGLEFNCTAFASNGQEAIEMLSEVPLKFDAVLMDLRMPIMDGLTAIRKCREELGLTKLPIVALTAEVGLSIKEEAMKAGASWFLSKPTKSQELVCVLRALALKQ